MRYTENFIDPNPEQHGEFVLASYKGINRVHQTVGGFDYSFVPVRGSEVVEAIEGWIQQVKCEDYCYTDVIMLGFDFLYLLTETALKYPHVRFTIVDGSLDVIPPNVQCIVFREEEAGYVAGALAGLITKTRHVGVIAGIPFVGLKSFLNSFVLGVLKVCSDCKIEAQYAWSFSSSKLGVTAAKHQLHHNVDVIFGAAGGTGSAAIKYAAENDIWVIGVDTDEWISTFQSGKVNGSHRLLGSVTKKLDITMHTVMISILSNQFRGGQLWIFDHTNGGIGISSCHEACSTVNDQISYELSVVENSLVERTLQVPVMRRSGHVDFFGANRLLNFEPKVHSYNTWIRGDFMRGRVSPIARSGMGSTLFREIEGFLSLFHVYIFGGWNPVYGELDDLWVYDLSGHIWMRKELGNNLDGSILRPTPDLLAEWKMNDHEMGWTQGGWPAARSRHSMVLLQPGYLLMFGGQRTDETDRFVMRFRDIWVYVPENIFFSSTAQWFMIPASATWSGLQNKWVDIPSPLARSGHSAVIIEDIAASILYRVCCEEKMNEPYNLELSVYSQIGSLSELKSNVMLIFGGRSNFHFENDLWLYWHWPHQNRLNLTHPLHQWSMVSLSGELPSPREGHSSAVKDMVVYVFSGKDSLNTLLTDLWMLDLSSIFASESDETANSNTLFWRKLQSAPYPQTWARMLSMSIASKSEEEESTQKDILFVTGGQNDNTKLANVWIYFIESDSWAELPYKNDDIFPRSEHIMLSYGSKVVLGLGQSDTNVVLNDIWWMEVQWDVQQHRICSAGFEFVGNTIGGFCAPCGRGKYNPDDGGVCQICPVGAICEGARISVQKGYWRSPNGNFYRCKYSNFCCPTGNCTINSPESCGINRDHLSILCSECLTGYSDWAGECVRCAGIDWKESAMLIIAGMLIGVVLTIKKPTKSAFFKLLMDNAQLIALVLSSSSEITQLLRYFKLLVVITHNFVFVDFYFVYLAIIQQ